MRTAAVYYKGEEAAILTQYDDGSFEFRYHDGWFHNPHKAAVSLTLPKNQQSYRSSFLFPFFFHLLPEGTNKSVVNQYLKIDADDAFGLLLSTAHSDTAGAVTVMKTVCHQ
jgi:HipA-like protein